LLHALVLSKSVSPFQPSGHDMSSVLRQLFQGIPVFNTEHVSCIGAFKVVHIRCVPKRARSINSSPFWWLAITQSAPRAHCPIAFQLPPHIDTNCGVWSPVGASSLTVPGARGGVPGNAAVVPPKQRRRRQARRARRSGEPAQTRTGGPSTRRCERATCQHPQEACRSPSLLRRRRPLAH
jgi:hypothetical protein